MPRNQPKSGAKRTHQEKDPKLVYDHLPIAKQIACYHFWNFLNTNGAEGWSPVSTPGSVFNWRSSNYIRENIKANSWPKIAQVRTFNESIYFILLAVVLFILSLSLLSSHEYDLVVAAYRECPCWPRI